jgi:hypothetical protein
MECRGYYALGASNSVLAFKRVGEIQKLCMEEREEEDMRRQKHG